MATHRRLGDGTILGTVPTGDNLQSIAFDGKNIWVGNWFPDGRVMKLTHEIARSKDAFWKEQN